MRFGDAIREILQSLFRLFPWPTEPGLRRVGSPGPLSPVIVTCNYDLTVRRVIRALEGVDVWLVVAPSSGINVWCAAAGGLLGTHQVVTALKTSGVEDVVEHRRAILPPLAATGVIARDVMHRCGWRTRFGPVYAEDIPRYLENGQQKGGRERDPTNPSAGDDMRRVRFGAQERLEMSAALGLPLALVAGLLALWLQPAFALPLSLFALAVAVAHFFLYDQIPSQPGVVFAGATTVIALAVIAVAGGGSAALVTAAVASLAFSGVLSYDHPGMTPVAGGAHFDQTRWRIALDEDRCDGIYSCWEVCPEACFEKRDDVRKIALAHEQRCVRCGACVVQCPVDALCFENEKGERIDPEEIRRFKLNLLGSRTVTAAPRPEAEEPTRPSP